MRVDVFRRGLQQNYIGCEFEIVETQKHTTCFGLGGGIVA